MTMTMIMYVLYLYVVYIFIVNSASRGIVLLY